MGTACSTKKKKHQEEEGGFMVTSCENSFDKPHSPLQQLQPLSPLESQEPLQSIIMSINRECLQIEQQQQKCQKLPKLTANESQPFDMTRQHQKPQQPQKKNPIKITDVTNKYKEGLLIKKEDKNTQTIFESTTSKSNSKSKNINQLALPQIITQQSIKQGDIVLIRSEDDSSKSLERLTNSLIVQNKVQKNKEIEQNQNSQIQRMALLNDSSFFFPLIHFEQKYIDKLNQMQFSTKAIDGITFIYPNQKTQLFMNEDRSCQLHNYQIFHICLEKSCIKNQKPLLCPFCIKDHRHHNFVELQELIAFVKGRQIQLQKIEQYFKLMFYQQTQKLKNKYQKKKQELRLYQLEQISQLFEEVKQKIQIYIQNQNQFFSEITEHLVKGQSSKIIESVQKIVEKEGTQLQLQQINFKFTAYLQENNEILDKLQYVPQFKNYPQNSYISIAIQGILLKIHGDYIQTYNDLNEQIKVELITNNIFEFVFYDLMWIQENQVIKLCENNENVEKSMLYNCELVRIIYIV